MSIDTDEHPVIYIPEYLIGDSIGPIISSISNPYIAGYERGYADAVSGNKKKFGATSERQKRGLSNKRLTTV